MRLLEQQQFSVSQSVGDEFKMKPYLQGPFLLWLLSSPLPVGGFCLHLLLRPCTQLCPSVFFFHTKTAIMAFRYILNDFILI